MSAREQAIEKMRADGLPAVAIATFARQFDRLVAGERGTMPECEIEPIATLPSTESFGTADAPLDQIVVIKLNGGLGTSMGMNGPKSLLEVHNGHSFLDLAVAQVLDLRRRSGARIPFVLMNSFATRSASLAALARYPQIATAGIAADFTQNRVPKLQADGDYAPVRHSADPTLEWAPPGHGDLYPALAGSGMLASLLENGFRYALVSNSDNLGATLDPRILAWMAAHRAPLVMEVADRTQADRKGGHLARRSRDGGLILREVAQTPTEDLAAFQDTARYRYFNTNTLWLDLYAIRDRLESDGVVDLPMIVNRKTVDPRDPESEPVLQLETAMGAAIAAFDAAAALRVPRSRFLPVKTTNDLLALRSDAYRVDTDGQVRLAVERAGRPPLVELDSEHYRLVDEFERRFPAGVPSLVGCERLVVSGDVRFGAGVVVRGDVTIKGPMRVPDGTLLAG